MASWRKCVVCNGTGRLFILNTRINIKDIFKKNKPLIPDTNIDCPFCKGKGSIVTKSSFLNPWRKKDE